MNEYLLKIAIENREKLIPVLFTRKQMALIEKYLNRQSMAKSEKAYLYSAIKKKADALSVFWREFYINGHGMIPEREEEAKEILKGMNIRAYISGSFLFSEKYN